jgi:iron complex transport system permease protein
MSVDEYLKNERKKFYIIILLVMLALVSGLIFMTHHTTVSVGEVPYIIYRVLSGQSVNAQEKIVLYMRMPMILMAFAAGMGLAVSGAAMQSITHNDLVSPFTLGVSAASAFGASLCIVSGNTIFHSSIGMVAGAFISSVICIFLVNGISIRTGSSATSLVLVGIAMNYLFSALSATVQFFAQEYKLGEIVQWTFGTLNKATWNTIAISFILIVVVFAVYSFFSISLDAMAFNDDEMVRSLGIDPAHVRRLTGLLAVLLTAAIISFTGVIGFVGLIAPHIARRIVGNEHRFFLPMSAVVGALLLLYADFIGRNLMYPVSIPVGIVVSFIGVPLFVHLVMVMKDR